MPNNNKSVTFVHGSDDFLVDRRARILYNEICDGNGEIFQFECDQHNVLNTLKNAISAISTVSLFDENDTIWLRSFDIFGNQKFSELENSMILELINLLSNSHAKNVIISSGNPDKRTRLFKEVFTKFDTIDIDKALRSNNFKEIVRSFASDQSVKIDDDAINILYEKCGSNYRVLEQEVQKLSIYVSRRKDKISCDDVKLLVDDYASENFFEPVEAFFNKNIRAFSRSIKRFFFVNSDARPLISALQSRNRLMIQIKTLIISKKLNCQNKFSLKKELEYASKFYHMDNLKKDQFNIFLQNPWYIEKMLNSCQQFTICQLLKLQISLSDAIKDLSSFHDDQQSILNKIATEFLC